MFANSSTTHHFVTSWCAESTYATVATLNGMVEQCVRRRRWGAPLGFSPMKQLHRMRDSSCNWQLGKNRWLVIRSWFFAPSRATKNIQKLEVFFSHSDGRIPSHARLHGTSFRASQPASVTNEFIWLDTCWGRAVVARESGWRPWRSWPYIYIGQWIMQMAGMKIYCNGVF